MVYPTTRFQGHASTVLIKKQLLDNQLMREVFGANAAKFKKFVEKEFKSFLINVLGHDCYYILYDPLNDEFPFRKYIEKVLMTDKELDNDDEYELAYDMAADQFEEQLEVLEDNGFAYSR